MLALRYITALGRSYANSQRWFEGVQNIGAYAGIVLCPHRKGNPEPLVIADA